LVEESKRLIPAECEDYFKEEFIWRWEEGYTAKQIFEELQFNDPDNAPWKLQLWHVYYFAQKYGLKKRNIQQKSRVC